MSLKTRLRLSILALVATVVFALSVLHLRGLIGLKFQDAEERAQVAAQEVKSLLLSRIAEQSAVRTPRPASLAERKQVWTSIVEQDRAIGEMLQNIMASSSAVVEIVVDGEDGRVLAASNPARRGSKIEAMPDFTRWKEENLWTKLVEVLSLRQDYQVSLPLGVPQQQAPVFTIRVVVSSVLMKGALRPEFLNLAIASGASLGAALLLAVLFSNLALRPLTRIGQAIDRISRGQFQESPAAEPEPGDVAAVESKLSLLGQQYRGVVDDMNQLRGNLEQMFEKLEEGVLLFDRNGRLVMAGRPAERLLGRGRWELLGQALPEVFPAESPIGVVVNSAQEFHRSVKDHPLTIVRPDETPQQLLVSVEVLESFPDGQRMGTLVTIRDAETRQQIQSQLDVSSRLASISRLTGGVAHEIKNPLNAMALHLEVLKSKLSGLDTGVEPEIEVIGREITRLDRVVKTFLDFTRPLELKMGLLDMVGVVKEVVALVNPDSERRHVEVELVAPSHPLRIHADADLIKQALLNVVINGVEAMSAGGRLSLEVAPVASDCVVRVTDEGVGIPKELREKIFQLYFSTKQKGSGIGLAMTFRVVQLHGGTIDFSSEPGKGTTFELHFPLAGST